LLYVRKIRKDPSRSLMYKNGWRPEENDVSAEDEESTLKEEKLSWRSIVVILFFLAQFGAIVYYSTQGDNDLLLNFMVAISLTTAVVMGFIAKFNSTKVADTMAKGLADMAFVGFIIGLAR